MRHRYVSTAMLLAAMVLAPPATAQAQIPVLGRNEARRNLERAPQADYPTLAQAAQVRTVVDVDVTIGADGRVIQAIAFGAPPMLETVAVEGVGRWRFRPFTAPDGTPIAVRTVMSVLYGVKPTPATLVTHIEYGDAVLRCIDGVERGRFDIALPDCETARDLETGAVRAGGRDPRVLIFHALALTGVGRHDESLAALGGKYDARGRGTDIAHARLALARAHHGLGNFPAAVDHYDDAYDGFNALRSRAPRGRPLRAYLLEQQRRIAAEYADALTQLGRHRDAERLLSRVKSIN